ncbi:hypothetical protein EVA_19776 [gut metagenome]|uniref:Uncharacterized protein n=1 Tax=gut metagenome TaxID=749906 RepID=J9FCG9_9ZZZZ
MPKSPSRDTFLSWPLLLHCLPEYPAPGRFPHRCSTGAHGRFPSGKL